MSPTDPPTDPAVLARDVERLTRDVARIGKHLGDIGPAAARVDQLAENVDELGAIIKATLERLRDGQAKVRSWLLVSDPELAVESLTDLVEWLDAVYLRFPGVTLPGCWMWHPAVVEELWCLRVAHAEAFSRPGWGSQAVQWHHNMRPGVVDRVRSAIGGCDLGQHIPGGQKAKPPAAAPLAGHVTAVAAAWISTGLPPEPTDEQLADAQAHNDAKLNLPNL